MTRAEIIQYARFILNELGLDYLESSSATNFDLGQAATMAYNAYARATRCFPRRYQLDAVVDQAIYAYSAFGYTAADTDSISVLADASNTTAFTLVSGKPDTTYCDRHYVTVSLTNNTGGADTGNAATYTVVGYLAGGIPYTEALAFVVADDLTDVADGALVTKTTAKPLISVTSITPSAAQPTDWVHSAGIGAQSPGDRLIEVNTVFWDTESSKRQLTRSTVDQMDKMSMVWRWSESGDPNYWLPAGERTISVWRPPSTADLIYAEGDETPDPLLFDSDTDTPDIHEDDHQLLGIKTALLAIPRNIGQEAIARMQVFEQEWQVGCKRAYRRIHNSGNEVIIVGRNAGNSRIVSDYPCSPGITNI
jgi:hypothetical protein